MRTTLLSRIMLLTFVSAILSVFLLAVSSCSDVKLVSYHLRKAEKHGGKIVCDTQFVDVPVTIKGQDGQDSIVYIPTAIPCQPCQPCESEKVIRWKERRMDKQERKMWQFKLDSAEIVNNALIELTEEQTKQTRIEVKGDVKKNKSDNQSGFWFKIRLFLLGCLMGAIFTLVIGVILWARSKRNKIGVI